MRILSVDSSAKSASAALTDNGRIIAECYSDAGLTHSKTLIPMIDGVFKNADTDLSTVDVFAVTHGPGSFTGVRIGVAAIKGLADALGKKCIGISTLEAIAWSLQGFNCIAVCAMDARCNQVYTASFAINGNCIERLSEDEAISIDELLERLKNIEGDIYFVGDGAKLCFDKCTLKNAHLAPAHIVLQHAGCVGLCAEKKLEIQAPVDAGQLTPVYLRVPQAERELKKRQNTERKD